MSPQIASGISGIFLFGFLAYCFFLHYWLAYDKRGPFSDLAIKYVLIPFYETQVDEIIYSKLSQGVPG
jgi:hypothetical protein